MQRRKFMLGLGVLATGSGAAALTGATLSNTVSPTADFRVNVEGGLVVEKGANFPTDDTTSTVDSDSDFGTGSDSRDNDKVDFIDSENSNDTVFDDLDDKTTFAAVADDEQNGALNIGIAIPFGNIPKDGGSDKLFEFPDLLKITNKASEDKDVAVAFGDNITGSNGSGASAPTVDDQNGFAISADSDGNVNNAAVSETGNGSSPTQLSYDEVAKMFQFTTDGNIGNAISPPGSSGGTNQYQIEAGSVTVSSDGGTQPVSLNVDISTSTGQKIHDFVNGESLDVNGGHFALVDQIFVGTSGVSTI